MFYGKPAFYERTLRDSELLEAVPAILDTPIGERVPGAAVFLGSKLLATITADGAYKLASDLADTLTHHRQDNAA